MPQFVVERDMPGVGQLSGADLKGASQTSCSVLRDLGPENQWVHGYVTDDKIYCIYRALSEDLIRRHGETAGFPANRISQVRSTINRPPPSILALRPHREFASGSGEMSSKQFTEYLARWMKLAVKYSLNGAICFAFIDWRHITEMLAAGNSVFRAQKYRCLGKIQ